MIRHRIAFALCFFVAVHMLHAQTLQLKMASYNMQQPFGTNWDGRKSTIVSVLNAQNCDVVGSQELHAYMRDYLLQNTSGYASYGLGRDGGDAGEASFIFYKTSKYTLDAANSGNFWLSNTPTVPSRWGGDYNRICTYIHLIEKSSGQGFYVFNIHNYMPAEAAYRLSAAKMLVSRVISRTINDPVWITGDFNSGESDAVTVWMKGGSDNGMPCRDTYRDVDPNGTIITGFGTKFDYIYCPNSTLYSTSQSYTVDPSGSDHLPIIAFVAYSAQTTTARISLSQNTPIYEGAEGGKTFLVNVTNAQLTNTLTSSRWTVSNLPAGVSVSGITRISSTQASISLTGNATIGTYTRNIKNVGLTIAAGELTNVTTPVSQTSGITLTKAPIRIPSKIEAEAFNDMDGIQTETTTDAGGGQNIGFLSANDWFTYTVSVAGTATYVLDIRNASQNANGQIQLLVDGTATKTLNFAPTGGWQTWTTTSANLSLTQGIHDLKFQVVTGDVNLNWLTFSVPTTVSSMPSVKLLEQNLWRRNTTWPTRRANIVSMINDQKPDIVAITEGDEGKSPELTALVPQYTLETGPWNEESTCMMYNASVVKVIERGVFGYSSTPDQNRVSDWGDGATNGWLRKCNWILFEHIGSGKRFYVYNNHLDALNSPLGPAYWRLEQAKLLATRIANRSQPQHPFVVIGDLNEDENGNAITYLKSGSGNTVPMKDTYRELLPSGDGYTFGTTKIDYILTGKTTTLRTRDANIVYQSQYGNLSDHNAIWAVLELTDSTTTPTPVNTNLFANYDGVDLSFTGFGGANFSKVANPFKSGINTSNNVGQVLKNNGSETWAGIYSATLSSKIDFSTNKVISMKVYSPVVGTMLAKLEDASNNTIFKEVSIQNTSINQWETLLFDFTGTASNTYNKLTLFFDFGKTVGNTFYFDDIQLTSVVPTCTLSSTITANRSMPLCSGNAVVLSASTGLGYSYVWKMNGSVLSTGTSFVTVSTSGSYTVEISNSSSCNGVSAPYTVTVLPAVEPSISVSTSTPSVCSGTQVTFSATGQNLGTNPTYRWFVNNSLRTTGFPFVYNPQSGDVVFATVSVGGVLPTCLAKTTTTSNSISMAVTQNVYPMVQVSSQTLTVCSGIRVTCLATLSLCGSAPSIRWAVNGILQTQTTSSFSFTPTNLDNVVCLVTVGGILPNCLQTQQVTSVGIQFSVPSAGFALCPLPAPSSISGPAILVSGSRNVVYSVVSVPGHTYQWRVPAGSTLVAGQGTPQVVVNFDNVASTGKIELIQTNANGSQSVELWITTGFAPTSPVIQGPTSVQVGQTGVVFSTPSLAGLSYIWTLPSGTSMVTGQGSNQISVDFPSSTQGYVKLTVRNAFGSTSDSLFVRSQTVTSQQEETEMFNITISPNPFTENSRIYSYSNVVYSVFDTMGQLVLNGIAKNGDEVGSSLVSGSYIVRFGEGKNVRFVRLVKN